MIEVLVVSRFNELAVRDAKQTGAARVLRGETGGVTFTHSLPLAGEICLGRGSESDLRLNIPEASRRHAKLRLTPTTIEICDVGSTNGTFVRRERLEPNVWTVLQVGEPFAIGDRMLVIQPGRESQDCERLTGRELFEERLKAELATFDRTRRPFGVCVFEGSDQGAWLDTIASVLSAHDVIGVLGESAIAVLLVGHRPEMVTQLASELEACMERRGSQPTVHCAFCPETGITVDRLLPRGSVRVDVSETVRPAMLVQRSAAMAKVYTMVAQVAPTPTSVLVYGATGTGKDVLAHEIHQRSRRKTGPFVALNCAALPENLLESELFGYEKGAFTGAVGSKPGQFELANGGTLFLDEIGEMPLLAQAKLLRVVEERAVLRLGGTKLTPVDVRIIAATNRDLRIQVDRGLFRADLFYRLNGFSISLPLLRERKDEIQLLVDHFVSRAASALGKTPPVIAPEVVSLFNEYDWPGNIRELRSVVERAVLLARHGFIRAEHLPDELVPAAMYEEPAVAFTDAPPVTTRLPILPERDEDELTIQRPPPVLVPSDDAPVSSTPRGSGSLEPSSPPVSLEEMLSLIERHQGAMRTSMLNRDVIAQALDRCGGNQTEAAKLLGVSRRTLIDRIERFGIVRPRKGGTAGK